MSRKILRLGHLELVWQNDAIERLAAQLSRKSRPAIYDAASNWYEPWYFSIRLEEEILRSRRYGHEMALVAIEFSNLGGPLSPDRMEMKSVLRNITQTSLRQTDLPGIVDSDRFVVCLPHTDRAGAEVVLDRLSRDLARYSVRIGFALYPDDGSEAEELMSAALQASYNELLEDRAA